MRLKLWGFLFVLILLSVIISVSVFAAQYAYPEAYFFIPSDVSFTVDMPGQPDPPGTYGSEPSYPGPPTGGATSTWISFNTSTRPATVAPYTLGDIANVQNGLTTPIFLITNVGNTPFDFHIQISIPSPEGDCLDVTAESACGAGTCAGATNFISPAVTIKNAEVQMVEDLPSTSGENILKVALYGSFTAGCSPQEWGPYNIYHRSIAD